MDSLNAFTGVVRRCVDDYGMISPGDRIAVGISGGKDSLVLLAALAYLRRFFASMPRTASVMASGELLPGVTKYLKAKPLASGLATNQSQHMAKT